MQPSVTVGDVVIAQTTHGTYVRGVVIRSGGIEDYRVNTGRQVIRCTGLPTWVLSKCWTTRDKKTRNDVLRR